MDQGVSDGLDSSRSSDSSHSNPLIRKLSKERRISEQLREQWISEQSINRLLPDPSIAPWSIACSLIYHPLLVWLSSLLRLLPDKYLSGSTRRSDDQWMMDQTAVEGAMDNGEIDGLNISRIREQSKKWWIMEAGSNQKSTSNWRKSNRKCDGWCKE